MPSLFGRSWLLPLAFCLLPSVGWAQANPLRDSLAMATAALEQHIDSVDLRLRRAACYVDLKQWEDAKSDYDYILDRHPGNPAALFFRAFVNERLGRNHFARLDYLNLLKVAPTSFEGKLCFALFNDRHDHHTEAMDQINLLIEQHPDSAVVYAARAEMENDRKQYALAEYDYTEALKRDPTNTEYLFQRALCALAQSHYSTARHDFETLIALGVPRHELEPFYEEAMKGAKR